MAHSFLCVVIAMAFHCIEGQLVCTPSDVIAHKLEDAPDAWKLMEESHESFHLVYHSRNHTFPRAFPCLHTKRTDLVRTRRQATYQYAYTDGNRVITHEKLVNLDKKDKAYPRDNEFSINLNSEGEEKLQDFQLIYTDYSHCALFWSWNLGAYATDLWYSTTAAYAFCLAESLRRSFKVDARV
uniref:Putative tick histamine binding protein n=1 Tax=Amblyomma tuberculatum TaxID=48802 RepID=A0A6M2E917_9ACAR